MKIINAKYKTSAIKKEDIICDSTPEFAFVGRSNVGKSSLINALVGQKGLAKTSQTAGLTKMINYFEINSSAFRLVDLPGYGFAQASKDRQEVWGSLMGKYLSSSPSLRSVFVLLDIRIEPTPLDKSMISYLVYNNIPFRLLATKCDKLSRMAIKDAVKNMANSLSLRQELILPTSARSREGIEEILEYIDALI